MFQNRRRSQRRNVRLEGMLGFINRDGREIGGGVMVKDISLHGVYLVSDVCPDIGCRIELLLNWPQRGWNSRRLLPADGKVIRLDNLASAVWGFGVDFESFPLDQLLEGETGVLTLEELEQLAYPQADTGSGF